MRLLGVLAVAGLTAATALAAPAGKGDPKKAIKPAVQARAKAIAVRVSDLPGSNWKAGPSDPSSTSPRCSYYKPNQSDLTENGDLTSPDYTRSTDGAYVSSRVRIFVSTAQAKTAYERVVLPSLPRCLGDTVAKTVTAGKVTFHSGSLALRSYGERSAAFRVIVTITSGTKSLKATIDIVVVQKGPVDIALIFGAIGGPVPSGVEQKVVGRVVDRA